jgi:hypothetical protein
MKAYEITEGFRDWFNKKKKKIGPQLMNYADIEMIQSVDRKAKTETRDVYNLKSRHGNIKFVYVKYPNSYEFRIILPNNTTKRFKFKTASELHKIFYKVAEVIQKQNGT